MLKYILTAMLISGLMYGAHAFGYNDPEHIGALCTTCHSKFSYEQPYGGNLSAPVKTTDVIKIFPCYKKPCHYSSPVEWGGRGNRYEDHMAVGICQNCHGEAGEFDIHKSHTKNDTTVVECNVCHASPTGWNSSKVTIPPYEDLYIADSALLNTSIRILNWEGECIYCHRGIGNASRQHDVHASVIESACVECHGQIIESVPNPLKKAIIGGGSTPEVSLTLAQKLMKEYFVLFDRISLEFLDFYNFMKE